MTDEDAASAAMFFDRFPANMLLNRKIDEFASKGYFD
jgi:hypothetical protein